MFKSFKILCHKINRKVQELIAEMCDINTTHWIM